MKKQLLLIALMALVTIGFAQDPVTIMKFTFPANTGTDDDFNANEGLDPNVGYDIRMNNMAGDEFAMEIKNGMAGDADYSAGSSNRDEGANDKYM